MNVSILNLTDTVQELIRHRGIPVNAHKISKCIKKGGTTLADNTFCMNNEPKTWDLANTFCESMDAKMITIKDKGRNGEVSAIISKVKSTDNSKNKLN